MSRYVSDVKIINAAQANVYAKLSDLSHLQVMKDNMPAELKAQIKAKFAEETKGKAEISHMAFTTDTASCRVSGFEVCMRIIDREELKTVKFAADNSPVPMTLWIQMLSAGAYETKIKVTIDVDIPFYLKPMIGGKLEGAADQLAEMLARIPY